MIRIGDFSRLARVSVATLRHYDELGLLKPAVVDQFTGYRYYAPGQLTRLTRILALKDLGFSLDQIAQVLDGVTHEELTGMLKMRRAQAEQSLAEEQSRLDRIAARLRQIQMEEEMPNYDVVVKTTTAMPIASCRITVPTNDQVGPLLGNAFNEAYGLIKDRGAKDAGPCLALWHQPASVLVDEDVEAAVPVDRVFPGSSNVKVYELPATEVASVIHEGDYATFNQAHAALLSWVESNGYRVLGTYREIYVQDAHGNPANAVTEIQYPVERKR